MTLYRHKECESCQEIEDTLREMVISCEVVAAEPRPRSDDLPAEAKAPVLVDGEKVIEGEKSIFEYLDTLKEFSRQWYKYQSDACYCDD